MKPKKTLRPGWVNPSAPRRTHGRHCACLGCGRRARKGATA